MERGEVSPDDIRDQNGLFSNFDRSKARLVSRRVHVRITMARGICDAPKDSTAHSRSEFFGSLIGAEVIYVCAGERNPEFRFMFPEKPRPEICCLAANNEGAVVYSQLRRYRDYVRRPKEWATIGSPWSSQR